MTLLNRIHLIAGREQKTYFKSKMGNQGGLFYFLSVFVQATLLSKDIVMLKMYFGDLNHALAWKAKRAVGPVQYIFSLI